VGTCGRLFMLVATPVVTPKTKNKPSHSNEQRSKIILNIYKIVSTWCALFSILNIENKNMPQVPTETQAG
jgi:hypothetical protein